MIHFVCKKISTLYVPYHQKRDTEREKKSNDSFYYPAIFFLIGFFASDFHSSDNCWIPILLSIELLLFKYYECVDEALRALNS